MKKSTKKLRTLGDLEMKQAVAGSKITVPPGAQVANEPIIPKPDDLTVPKPGA
jgi:hypothetical protein